MPTRLCQAPVVKKPLGGMSAVVPSKPELNNRLAEAGGTGLGEGLGDGLGEGDGGPKDVHVLVETVLAAGVAENVVVIGNAFTGEIEVLRFEASGHRDGRSGIGAERGVAVTLIEFRLKYC